MKLKGKVSIVTASAGAGIGQATARTLAREGAAVVVSDAHERRTREVAESLRADGHRAIGVPCDVRVWEQVQGMVKATLDEFGRIDVLVNNAGREVLAQIVDTTEENWDLVLDVCLKGTFLCTKAVLPTMIAQKSGSIVNLSSINGWLGSTLGECAYCSAKAGVMAFTRVTAAENARHGIRANCIAPGAVPNPFLERVYPKEAFERMKQGGPLGRAATPDDMASIIAFLASDEAAYISGETINASGGSYFRP